MAAENFIDPDDMPASAPLKLRELVAAAVFAVLTRWTWDASVLALAVVCFPMLVGGCLDREQPQTAQSIHEASEIRKAAK